MQVVIDLEYLIEFLNELRAAGFDVSTQQYIAAQDLLIALAANGQLPDGAPSLRTLLGPIVCSTAREQENFYRHFDRWVKRNPQAAVPVQIDGELQPAVLDPVLHSWTTAFRKPVVLLGTLILGVGLITGVLLLVSAQTLTVTGHVVDADKNSPVSGATISYPVKTLSSDGEGKFSITYRKKELPIRLVIKSDGYEIENQVINVDTKAPLEVRLVPLPFPDALPIQSPTVTPTPKSIPAPVTIDLMALPDPPPDSRGKLGEWGPYGGMMLPLFLFSGWWIWKTRLNRALLQRLQRAAEPRLDHLVVKGGAAQLFQGPSFRRTIQELRRHRQRGASDLDAQRTVSRTIQHGGLFMPAYGSRQTLPEYLVLIDRACFADQQARLDDEIVRRLVQDNVFVDTYHFQGDARFCRKQDKNAPYISLQEIVALHPDHHLIVFSDGSTFINPLTGETERWVEMFASWTTRALLTPESPAQWGHRERSLAELGFIILPATKDGLAVLTELLGGGAVANIKPNRRTRPYPSILRDRTMRWLENHEPQPANLQRLCDQLKVFLGTKGYHWLSACAVYPTLYWDLTLYLGFKLIRDRDQIEDRLLSLVRLPWFRYGSIPDWLRLRLISDLSATDEASVRKTLEDLLLTVMQQPADGIRLDIASEEGSVGFLGRLQKRFTRWKFRRFFMQFIKDEPSESPLRDYVFLTFMSGRRPRKLTVSLPDTIRKLFFPQGQRALGMRPAGLLALALAGSLALFFFNWRAKADNTDLGLPSFYTQMSLEQQKQFVQDRAQEISTRFGRGTTIIPETGLIKIKEYVDGYVQRIGNNSTRQWEEDLRGVFARAILRAPSTNQIFEERKLAPVLGLYLPMIISEYGEIENRNLFAGVRTGDAEVASRAFGDLGTLCASALGSDSADITLGIICFFTGPDSVRRSMSLVPAQADRNAWFLLDRPENFTDPNLAEARRASILQDVPRFFAAAIVGENPQSFRMKMEPLSSYRQVNVAPNLERISTLLAQFSGPERRNASDELVQLYSQNKAAVVEALINAILSEGAQSYRVNLYIARTLGMIRPKWEGTSEQLVKVVGLRSIPDYSDQTFRDWVDRAISGFVETVVQPSLSPSTSPSPSPQGPVVVRLAVARSQVLLGERIAFVAVIVPDVPGVLYRFSFGDGSSTVSQRNGVTSYSYSRIGRFAALVEIQGMLSGARIQETSRVQTIDVRDSVGGVLLRATPALLTVGGVVNFLVQTDSQGVFEYSFNFGDGSPATGWQSTRQITHRYISEGSFTATVVSRDQTGTVIGSEGRSFAKIIVSPNLRQIPNLIGRSASEVRRMFNSKTDIEFNLGAVTYENDEKHPPGTVLSQQPSAGTRAPTGTEINIVVAKSLRVEVAPNSGLPTLAMELVAVPNVIGNQVDEALKILSAVGLSARVAPGSDSVQSPNQNAPLPKYVKDQDPKPGTKVPKGTEVTLKIEERMK